jgi:hypothetical protein
MKINILSPGRFHVCDLARELARNGYDVKFYSFKLFKRLSFIVYILFYLGLNYIFGY